MKRKIGLPFWRISDNSFGSTISYVMYLSLFGEVIPLMPQHSIRTDLDLLVLPGGADIDPSTYGEAPEWYTGKPDLIKEYFDKVHLPEYIAARVPILGICRGHQAICTHFGGKLIQDMHHETNKAEDPYAVVHQIKFEDSAERLKIEVPNNKLLGVNSRHHQIVSRKYIGEGLIPIASHQFDNSIEMVCHETLPIVGIQWHPEDVWDKDSRAFTTFILRHLIIRKSPLIQ